MQVRMSNRSRKPALVLIKGNIEALHAQVWRATFGPIEELRALVERLAPKGNLMAIKGSGGDDGANCQKNGVDVPSDTSEPTIKSSPD